jgi:glycosyltransferase involved in cell wall biosynthesis
MGKPILIGVEGNATDLVLKAKAGLKCEPGNPRSIVEVVEKFQSMPQAELDAMGENGRKYYQQELALAVGTKQFAVVLESVVQ